MPADEPVKRLNPRDVVEGRVLERTKLQYLRRAGLRELEDLQTGVFFILAWWSGVAHVAIDHLVKAVLSRDPPEPFEVVVVDTDGIPELYDSDLLRGKIHGAGESIWKRGGSIVDIVLQPGQIRDYEDRIDKVLR